MVADRDEDRHRCQHPTGEQLPHHLAPGLLRDLSQAIFETRSNLTAMFARNQLTFPLTVSCDWCPFSRNRKPSDVGKDSLHWKQRDRSMKTHNAQALDFRNEKTKACQTIFPTSRNQKYRLVILDLGCFSSGLGFLWGVLRFASVPRSDKKKWIKRKRKKLAILLWLSFGLCEKITAGPWDLEKTQVEQSVFFWLFLGIG